MDRLDRKILRRIQTDLPLVPRPFAALAEELGLTEQEVLERLRALHRDGIVRRLGPVLDPGKVGRVATLAAVSVPEERLEGVAAIVSACEDVTHNYRRVPRHGRCPYNLWFTVSARSPSALAETVAGIERAVGLPVVTFPTRRKFKIAVRHAFRDEDADG